MEVQKQIRENTQELHDFLRGLQDWEKDVKNKDNELKNKAQGLQPKETRPVREKKKKKDEAAAPATNAAKHTYDYFRDKWDKFDVDAALKEVDEDDDDEKPKKEFSKSQQDKEEDSAKGTPQMFSNNAALELDPEKDSLPDAVSEKELGNNLFKEKKYVQAIECYSRSIGFHPTAVAYANRAMALLKIRRYEDAEMDCSEAIALDDRYTKAYARRGTARRERDKLLGAVEDFEFALRLEPQNKDLQILYEETRALYEKKNAYRPPEKKVAIEVQRPAEKPMLEVQRSEPASAKPTLEAQKPATSKKMVAIDDQKPVAASPNVAESAKKSSSSQKQKGKTDAAAAVQASTIRAAAATAMNAVTANMTAPKSSFEFETLWRGFGDDVGTKARLLKLMEPTSFPKVFRDALSAALMVDIIKTLETIVNEDAIFVAEVLDNLTKVGRFTMTIMCLSQNDKNVIRKLWEALPSPMENIDKWDALRKQYRV